MNESKYNYVVFGGHGFYEHAYADLRSLSNVVYFKDDWQGFDNCFSRFLLRANFNYYVNRIVPTPFSHYVYPRLYPFHFNDDRPLVFVFFNCRYVLLNSSYVEYLKKKYPTAKLVLYFQDIVESNPLYNVERYQGLFDFILSYDKGDCEKYGFKYYPTPYSYVEIPDDDTIKPFDVYFCGKAKTRYEVILDVYKQCTDKGLKCNFFIYGTPRTKRVDGEGLVYEGSMSYKRNLQYVKKCRCLLEVMQQGATGFTPRMWEAITYGKHIMTNNADADNIAKISSSCVHKLDDVDNISSWIRQDINDSIVNILVKSPISLLNYIESL